MLILCKLCARMCVCMLVCVDVKKVMLPVEVMCLHSKGDTGVPSRAGRKPISPLPHLLLKGM